MQFNAHSTSSTLECALAQDGGPAGWAALAGRTLSVNFVLAWAVDARADRAAAAGAGVGAAAAACGKHATSSFWQIL